VKWDGHGTNIEKIRNASIINLSEKITEKDKKRKTCSNIGHEGPEQE
jgi:hypothetical protein